MIVSRVGGREKDSSMLCSSLQPDRKPKKKTLYELSWWCSLAVRASKNEMIVFHFDDLIEKKRMFLINTTLLSLPFFRPNRHSRRQRQHSSSSFPFFHRCSLTLSPSPQSECFNYLNSYFSPPSSHNRWQGWVESDSSGLVRLSSSILWILCWQFLWTWKLKFHLFSLVDFSLTAPLSAEESFQLERRWEMCN